MRKRISLLIAALMLALTMSLGGMAFGAPITCEGNQTLTHTDSGWQCLAGNSDNGTSSTRHQGNDNKEGKVFPPPGK